MKAAIDQANAVALQRMQDAQPVWTDVRPAHEAVPGMDKFTLFHSGPPITWDHMSRPMQGAIAGALKYEGLAGNEEEAFALAGSGKIKFSPCHHVQAVGPMTGIISYSMPLLVIENKTYGNVAYSTINEGSGDVLRFGAYSDEAVKRLKWMAGVLAPALKAAVREMKGLSLKVIMAQALQMGDELHMRNQASSALFLKAMAAPLAAVVEDPTELREIMDFLTRNNDQFFLNYAMAANKVTADAAQGIENSTVVTAIARNGVDMGIRISGLGEKWFTAPAPPVDGLYFAGFSAPDANPDIGDSAIMETCGLGGFAMAAAPAIVRFLGAGTYRDALMYTRDMYEITVGENSHYAMPNLDFRGTPLGIDIRKVVQTGITPAINTAIASKEAGVGMIGAGVARAPLSMFEQALMDFAQQFNL
jgi:hypothetical protein